MDTEVRNKSLSKYTTYVFIGLLFVVSALVLIRATLDIQHLRQSGAIPARHGFSFKRHGSSSVPSPSFIEGWMTFGYINQVFGLPPAFLQHQLGIADSKYPNVQIARYAKSNGVEVNTFLVRVRQVVGEYKAGVSDR